MIQWWRILSRRTYDALEPLRPDALPDYLGTRGLGRWLVPGMEKARTVEVPWRALMFLMEVDLAAGVYRITDTWIIDEEAARKTQQEGASEAAASEKGS